jgi:hypothetical protein
MSRSRRKTPIMGLTTAESERKDKQRWHRRFRAVEHRLLARMPDEDEHIPPEVHTIANVWSFAKDGKQHITGPDKKRWMRK